ncbi:MAG: MotA/TolQ/ExbB proton channel family protein [Methylotenera sp.]|uniref:MotA/TolQ/ExbB proton channel family protein n=1 Tax=Methylotenera sp. TaxID=2051956 RepID=UPI002489BF7C|nr:MotA/TolQ/ExbB proton channel family protein [Methylotenera sp.]MDI1308952.1 MotA/TolQ/ExbB proton channel family protein [Methylotenera sp.]
MDNIPDIVDVVLYFLAGLSVLTWAILIVKSYVFWKQKNANTSFISHYTGVTRLTKLPEALYKAKGSLNNLSNKVMLNLKAWRKDSSLDVNAYSDMLKQSLREERHQQQVRLESGLAVLASIGSTSPFIGLFGTVWGIMHALKGISASGSAGLDVVAGPIGEALIATAMGIATAIPAVLSYNYFLRQSRLAAADMDHFSERLQLLAKHSDYKVD